ncbi:MAG: type II toxin-antitoxin system VapB family antitoxin [Hyphomicrobiales bacterium]
MRGPHMPLHIRDEVTIQLVRKLAERKGVGLTEAVRLAVEGELRREEHAVPLRERIRPIQERILNLPPTGFAADEAFFDELSGNR